jgi:hypothetical protein
MIAGTPIARTVVCLVAMSLLGFARPASAADSVAKGYEETISQNHHGIGVSFGVGGLNGVAYRHYFGNFAIQADILPLVADSGNYVAVFGGLSFIDYLVMWNRASRNTIFPSTTALRFVGGTGIWLSRQANSISVPQANCQTAECQAINNRSAPVDYFAHVGLGLGIEMGAIAQPGLSAAIDLQMTVMWDQAGFYGAYPLPSGSLMYNW